MTVREIDVEIARLNNSLKNVVGTKTHVYSRVVGYYGSVEDWNKGKRQEYSDRKEFLIGGTIEDLGQTKQQVVSADTE